MNQIIVSDLETNQELDRQALNDVMGGKPRRGGHKNVRHVKYYYEEKYQESHRFKHQNPCYHYNPCHYDHFHCHR